MFRAITRIACLDWWMAHAGMSLDEARPYLYQHTEQDAVRQALRVAAGLDSMVLGEPRSSGADKRGCPHGGSRLARWEVSCTGCFSTLLPLPRKFVVRRVLARALSPWRLHPSEIGRTDL